MEETIAETVEVVADIVDYSDFLNDILMTLGQIEGILWFFVFVITITYLYRFIRVFI